MSDNRHLVMTAQAVTKAQDFAKSLDDGYRRLLKGIKPNAGELSCHQLVGNALYVDGGIVCPLICAYTEFGPDIFVANFLELTIEAMERVFETAKKVAKLVEKHFQGGIKYVQHRCFDLRRFFSRKFYKRLCQARPLMREQVAAVLCNAVRDLLEWLRTALIRLEETFTPDPMRAIELSPYARGVVAQVDMQSGLLVLKSDARHGCDPYHILPTSRKAWEYIRLLCENDDPNGDVELPADYGSAFHRTDSDNSSLDGDYRRLALHIVPGLRHGSYHLSLIAKAPLLHGQ